jgi:transposase
MAVSKQGIVGYELLDHNCRKADFVTFVSNLEVTPGTTMLMDNVAFHHSREVKEIAAAKSLRVLYTPPYSPRTNAIENVFGMLKPEYRRQCPPQASEHFNYQSLLLGILESWKSLKRFDTTFDHALHFVQTTLLQLQTDPSFRFSGYG